MPNQYRMSYFMPPIAPVRNEQGRMVTPPTLLPFCEVSVEQVFQMITCNENLKLLTAQVRNAPDTAALRDTLRHLHTPQQQVFRIPFRAGRDRCGQPRLLRRSRQYAPSAIR